MQVLRINPPTSQTKLLITTIRCTWGIGNKCHQTSIFIWVLKQKKLHYRKKNKKLKINNILYTIQSHTFSRALLTPITTLKCMEESCFRYTQVHDQDSGRGSDQKEKQATFHLVDWVVHPCLALSEEILTLYTVKKKHFYFRSLACCLRHIISRTILIDNHSVFDLLSPLKPLYSVPLMYISFKSNQGITHRPAEFHITWDKKWKEGGERQKLKERVCWGKSSLEIPIWVFLPIQLQIPHDEKKQATDCYNPFSPQKTKIFEAIPQ